MEPPEKQYPNEPKYKPRRTRGTPSSYYRNVFACSFIALGFAIYGLLELTPAATRWRQRIKDGFFDDSPEYVERINMLRQQPGFTLPKPREKQLQNLQAEEDWKVFPVFTKDEGK